MVHKHKQIIVLGTFNVAMIAYAIDIIASKFHAPYSITHIYDNQITLELANPNSKLYTNNGINIICIRIQDFFKNTSSSLEPFNNFLTQLEQTLSICKKNFIVCICPSEEQISDLSLIHVKTSLKNLNQHLYIIDTEDFMPLNQEIYNLIGNMEANIPYNESFDASIAIHCLKTIYGILENNYKVIVVDGDNTLWHGVAAEQESLNYNVTLLDVHYYLQKQLIKLHEMGFLICIASKNNESDIEQVFNSNQHMPLKSYHITAWQVNWKPKYKNILFLADFLNLSVSNFIFMDDSQIECDEIKTFLPETLSIQTPQSIEQLKLLFNNLWALEKPRKVATKTRSKWYKAHIIREQDKLTSASLRDFLETINLKLSFTKVLEDDIPRISELSYRVTQFNLSNIKYDEYAIYSLMNKGTLLIKVHAADKYGDYGIVGFIVYNVSNQTLFVETFVLSCRALGRGIEHQMLRHLGTSASSLQLKDIQLKFCETTRNIPAKIFLTSISAKITGDDTQQILYTISTQDAQAVTFNPDNTQTPQKTASKNLISSNNSWELIPTELIALLEYTTYPNTILNIGKPQSLNIVNNSVCYILEDIWTSLLNCETINSESNFLTLGGNSILALRLIYKIYDNFNIYIKLYKIFEFPIFSNQLTYIKQHLGSEYSLKPKTQLNQIKHNSKSSTYIQLTNTQKELWYLDLLSQQNSWYYNIAPVYKINGYVDQYILQKALITIIRHSDSLRSYVENNSNMPMFMTLEEPTFYNFTSIDASHLTVEELNQQIYLAQTQPFNLYKYPLYRIRLFILNPNTYILVPTFHHLIFDGQSIRIFNDLLAKLYAQYLSGDITNKLILSEYKYVDFIKWQEKLGKSPQYINSLNYWVNELQNLTMLKLVPNTRGSDQNHYGKVEYFQISDALINNLQMVAHTYNTTLFCLCHSAFTILLYYISKQNDIIIGTPISNRVDKNFDNTIGNFISNIVLRTLIDPYMTISQLISYNHKKLFDAYEHQSVSFNEIVAHVVKERSNTQNPIYQIMLVMQDDMRLQLTHTKTEILATSYDHAKLDLVLELNQHNNIWLEAGFYYNTNMFEKQLIDSMIYLYNSILANLIISSPSQCISNLLNHKSLNSPKPGEDIIAYNKLHLIHLLFENAAIKYPNNIAIKDGNREITYEELEQLSYKLAVYLYNLNIPISSVIALHFHKSIDVIVAIIACFKLGVTYVPIDPNDPTYYKQNIINDCAPRLVLTNTACNLQGSFAIINIADIQYQEINTPQTNPIFAPYPQSTTAYIMYTSGTSGSPKGIVIPHSAIYNLINGISSVYNISNNDCGLLFHAICFDFSVWEIFSILANGGKLVIYNHHDYNYDAFWNYLVTENVTIINQTPPVFENLLLHQEALCKLKHHLSLRLIIFGGAPLYPKHLEPWIKIFGDNNPQIYNMYGITETTVHTTYQQITKQIVTSNKSLIGRPIPGVKIELRDEQRNLITSPNIIGEIFITGAGLAKGYLNDPLLTQKSFIQIDQVTWYRSGDLAKWDNNMLLEFISRSANYIKIRGFRVDPNYVASIIEKYNIIKKAYVFPDQNNQNLCSIVLIDKLNITLNNDDINSIRSFLVNKIPKYMIPTNFYLCDKWPIDKNGKIDFKLIHKLLPPQAQSGNTAEKSTNETLLIQSWQQVLNIGHFDRNANFFDLGGNSFLLIKLCSAIQSNLSTSIRLIDLAINPTFKSQLELINQKFAQVIS